MNKENLLNNDKESDEETIGDLSDSDIDEIATDLLKSRLNNESEEYR